MRTGKRTLAGLAAGALTLGLLTVASAASPASAAPTVKPKALATASVTGVRPTSAGVIAPARLSWTGAASFSNAPASADGATLTLTGAPSAGAVMTIDDTSGTDDTVSLTQNNANIGVNYIGTNYNPTGSDDSKIYFNVNTAGTYSGRIANGTDTVSFSFTTAGAPASMTITPSTQTVLVGAVATVTVTLRDSAGNPTQGQSVDNVTVASSSTSDTVAITAPTADQGSQLQLGTFDDTIATQAAGTSTITVTPFGTLPPTVTAVSATVVKSGAVNSIVAKSILVTSPTNALQLPLTVTNATDTVVRTYQVPELTTSLTVQVDDTTANAVGSTVRLRVDSDAGTVNGSTAAVYINLVTDASRRATTTLTLGGAAVLQGSTITINQVNVLNATIAPSAITVAPKTPVVSATGVAVSPSDSQVAALGATTPVTVSIFDDSFGIPQANYGVSAVRGADASTGTVLNTSTTNSSGVATVSVTNAATAVNNTVEQYSFRIAPPAAAVFNDNNVLQITYTTGGGITTLSVAPSGNSLGSTVTSTTPSPTGWTAPLILTPGTDGLVGTQVSDDSYTVSTGVKVSTDPVYSLAQFTATATPRTNVTVTVPTGVLVAPIPGATGGPTGTTLYSGGSSTLTVASGTPVVVWATKTGEHNITVTAGDKTVTFKVKAINNAARAYNIAVTPPTQSVQTGAFTNVTVAVTDMFGNAVTTDDTSVVTATTSGQVRISTGAISETGIKTNATGLATVSLTASGTAGSGSVSVAPPSTTTVTAWQSTYVPPTGIAAPKASAAATVTVTAPPSPIPTTMTWGTIPTSIGAGASSTLQATLKDQNGAVMDNTDVNVTITGNAVLAGNGGQVGQYETNAEGKINVTVVAGASGSFTVTATADGSTIASATTSSITITAAPSPSSITIAPAAGGSVPAQVDAGASVPMVARVVDTAGGASALTSVEVSISGDATFANGNKQYVASTGAAGTIGFTVVAGESGSFRVTATVVTKPTVTTTTSSITIVEKPIGRLISIVGSRTTVNGKPGIEVEGSATGFTAGDVVKPYVKFPGATEYTEGAARPTIDADGNFFWQRKTGKKAYVYFKSEDGTVKSNTITIPAA